MENMRNLFCQPQLSDTGIIYRYHHSTCLFIFTRPRRHERAGNTCMKYDMWERHSLRDANLLQMHSLHQMTVLECYETDRQCNKAQTITESKLTSACVFSYIWWYEGFNNLEKQKSCSLGVLLTLTPVTVEVRVIDHWSPHRSVKFCHKTLDSSVHAEAMWHKASAHKILDTLMTGKWKHLLHTWY